MRHIPEIDPAALQPEVSRGGLVVVDAHALWCGACKALDGVLDQLAPEFAGRVRFFKVDVDKHPEFARRHGISGLPTVLIHRNGALIARLPGGLPKAELSGLISRLAPLVA